MIVSIEGILERATPLTAIVNAGGIGYLVNIPVSTAAKLPANGEKVKLHTHAVYREDSQSLYGFANEEERNFFQLLIEKVSGVGPKVGIGMMSKLDLTSLISAICNEDSVLLAKTPGIGKKTAERVIIELKDKLGAFARTSTTNPLQAMVHGNLANSSAQANHEEDAVLALLALGYKQVDATKSVGKAVQALGPNASSEALIKAALS